MGSGQLYIILYIYIYLYATKTSNAICAGYPHVLVLRPTITRIRGATRILYPVTRVTHTKTPNRHVQSGDVPHNKTSSPGQNVRPPETSCDIR